MIKLNKKEQSLLTRAQALVAEKLANYSLQDIFFNSPNAVTDYLRLSLALEEREHFEILFLTSQNQLIKKRTFI